MKKWRILEESGLLINTVNETITNDAEEEKIEFLSTLLGLLGASLLGNLLKVKGTIGVSKGSIRAGQYF